MHEIKHFLISFYINCHYTPIVFTKKVIKANMKLKVKTDRHGLPMWLLWLRCIISFELYFCSHKRVFKGFYLL